VRPRPPSRNPGTGQGSIIPCIRLWILDRLPPYLNRFVAELADIFAASVCTVSPPLEVTEPRRLTPFSLACFSPPRTAGQAGRCDLLGEHGAEEASGQGRGRSGANSSQTSSA
jgi:hypothetical protein